MRFCNYYWFIFKPKHKEVITKETVSFFFLGLSEGCVAPLGALLHVSGAAAAPQSPPPSQPRPLGVT